MGDEPNDSKGGTFEEWINRKAEEYEQRRHARDLQLRKEPTLSRDTLERPSVPFREEKPDRLAQQLEERFARADVEYRIRYERLHRHFESMFRNPEHAIQRFNAICESRGEQRTLKILERKPQRVSPTKDALRAYFQHSTRERDSARDARQEVSDAFRAAKEAEELKYQAEQALRRYQRERERDFDR